MSVAAVGTNTTAPVPSTTTNTAAAANSNSATKTATDNGSSTATTSGDQVTVSSQAQAAQDQASQTQASQSQEQTPAPATPPADRGALVFDAAGATVGGKRVALMDIIDNTDGTYTDTERQAAVRQINQRETAGFRWAAPDGQDPVALKQYYATYLNYLTKLSPEEQASSRYAGQIDQAHQLIKDADRQIAMASIQQINLANYSDSSGMGLFGPLMSGISARISQQLAGLPNTNLSTTARYFQQAISQPRTADQVLASPDPTASDDSGSTDGSSDGTPGDVSGSTSRSAVNIQA
jgi:hypothetical protein